MSELRRFPSHLSSEMRFVPRLVALGLFAVGCAPPPPAAPPRGDPGDLEIVVENHLGWPYRVTTVVVALDGSLLYRHGGETAPHTRVAALRALPTGDHTLQLLVRVDYTSGSVADACALTLRSADTFVLGPRPARVTLDLYAAGPSQAFTDRVRVDVRREGTYASGEVASAPAADRSGCGTPDGSIQHFVCRANARVEEAERRRDVIATQCYRGKQVALSALAREEDRAALEPALPNERELKLRLVRERAGTLWRELEQCVSEDPVFFARDEHTSDTPSCRGDELLPDARDVTSSRR